MTAYDGFRKYDRDVASTYDIDRIAEDHWAWEQAFILQLSANRRLGRLLDLPVGTGRFLEFYGDADSVIGVDISDAMLEIAREKVKSLQLRDCRLLRDDVLKLNHADRQFETTICFRLMHLLPPQLVEDALRELGRVTSDRLFLQVYAAPQSFRLSRLGRILAKVKALFWKKKQQARPWSHIQSFTYTRSFFLSAARKAGLKVVRIHALGSYETTQVEVIELARE